MIKANDGSNLSSTDGESKSPTSGADRSTKRAELLRRLVAERQQAANRQLQHAT